MTTLISIACMLLIFIVLHDTFETVILPRRVTRPLRLTRLFYAAAWPPWSRVSGWIGKRRDRETFLSVFGPLSLLVLLGIWAAALIFAFALLQWKEQVPLRADIPTTFGTYLYMSGTTFFTLGLGDVRTMNSLGHFLTVVESGLGFGFLALVITYLPVLYQGFSQREEKIATLDARAGSPPTAAELLRRNMGNRTELANFLREWESWSAELLETHLSYPVLCYYRSQHNNQSWLAAITSVLDCCAVLIATAEPGFDQARLTFAMGRHAVVDLAQIFNTPPSPPRQDRLPSSDFKKLQGILRDAGIAVDGALEQRLAGIREMYEPYVQPLSEHLRLEVPPWLAVQNAFDNWQTSRWGRISTTITKDGFSE